MTDVQRSDADEAWLDEGDGNPVMAFVGRVLGGFLTLTLLFAIVAATIAVVYWSKNDTPRPHLAPAVQGPFALPGG